MPTRADTIHELANLILCVERQHPVRVGIDGVDCSGKTTIADELAATLGNSEREIIRVSIDGFHNPREIRYRQGRSSPRGFYEDTFNLEAIITGVLEPLGPGGDGRYCRRRFDFKTDTSLDEVWQAAASNCIVLFDGIFLHRPELIHHWDFSIFVEAGFDETVRRARQRDQYLLGSADDVEAMYRQRYVPGQEIYIGSVAPASVASVVLDNNDVRCPSISLNRNEQRGPDD